MHDHRAGAVGGRVGNDRFRDRRALFKYPGECERQSLLAVACRAISFAQGGLFADEFPLLRAAEISLPSIVINTGVGVDPNDLIALAG